MHILIYVQSSYPSGTAQCKYLVPVLLNTALRPVGKSLHLVQYAGRRSPQSSIP